LAEGGINQEAASIAHPQDEDADEEEDTPARPVRAPMKAASAAKAAGAAKSAGAGRGASAGAARKAGGRR